MRPLLLLACRHSVANNYIDILNSLPIVKLLHAKWERGARGHYFAQLLLFCTCLASHAMLCQHLRRGLVDSFVHGSRSPVLRDALQSAETCASPYVDTSVVVNGTVIPTRVGWRLPAP